MRHTPYIDKRMKRSPSNRSFGFLFTVVFAGFGVYGLHQGSSSSLIYGCFIVGFIVGMIALVIPQLLAPFNKAWLLLGDLLGRFVSPIVLGVIFFGLLTPIGLITRLFGRDELRLKRQSVNSYWIDRDPPGPCADSFKNQF